VEGLDELVVEDGEVAEDFSAGLDGVAFGVGSGRR
jgi:hypothetical protein